MGVNHVIIGGTSLLGRGSSKFTAGREAGMAVVFAKSKAASEWARGMENTAVGDEVRQGTEQDRLALQVQLRTLDFILNELRSLLGQL